VLVVSTSALARSVVEAARTAPGRLRPWLRNPWATDLSVVLVVGVIAVFGSAEASQEGNGNGTRGFDWLGWALLLGATLSLLARRRRPGIVLLVTCGAIAASVALGYPTGPIWGMPLIALYTAAATGRRTLALLAASAMALVLVVWAVQVPNPGSPAEIGFSVLLVALSVAVGEVARGRRDYLAEAERRAAEAERTQQEVARRHAGEERLRLARDLHDITAHTIAVIAIQAGVADEALERLDDRPEPAREAVRAIRSASRQAMAELKATVAALREGAAPRGALPTLDRLDELVRLAEGAGVRVDVEVTGTRRPLPPAVDLTAFRIVQESLTNVLRHAQASRATVHLRYDPDALQVEVGDDGRGAAGGRQWTGPAAEGGRGAVGARPGRGPAGAPGSGHGLAVMAERAAAVGGRLVAGPGAERGFRVQARLPLPRNGGMAPAGGAVRDGVAR
jgi:signal transduction histidine kinase